MVYSRRVVWIAVSAFAIVATFVDANNLAIRSQSERPSIIIDSSRTQQQLEENDLHDQKEYRSQSKLVRAMSKHAWDNAKNIVIQKTIAKTQQPSPPEGIYRNKPVLRGQFHKWGAILFPPLLGLPLCRKALTANAAKATNAPNFFKASLLFCLGIESVLVISATLHTFPWKTETNHQKARKLDFTGIFFGTACLYSSMGKLAMGDHFLWNPIERIVWACAILGTVLKWKVPDCPHWVNAAVFLVQGWAGFPLVPDLLFGKATSLTTAFSMFLGGIFVTLGALAYSFQWPYNKHQKAPYQIVFGPHEVFHIASLFCFGCFWISMWTRISELSLSA